LRRTAGGTYDRSLLQRKPALQNPACGSMTLRLLEPKGPVPEPQPAATVVLLRSSPAGPEAFLLRRKATASFMPGAYVFPGGMVDPEDAGLGADPFLVAAARECFEEAGILLAINSAGDLPPSAPNWPDQRRAITARPALFRRFLQDHSLTLATEAVRPWSWWLTPEIEKRRFDTRFFVALAPPRQEGAPDGDETTNSCWMPVRQAMERYQSGEIDMAPPTVATLVEMSAFSTVSDIMEQAPWDAVCRCPCFARNGDDDLVILLPGDPEYPRDAEAVRGIHRVTWKRGRWWVT